MIDWLPSPADVGSVLRARTKDKAGNEIGTFGDTTRPTGDQVQDIIDSIVADIDAQVASVPEEVQPFARSVAKMGAACQVELTYFPEQIRSGRSAYAEMVKWYDAALLRLIKQANDINTGTILGDEVAYPSFVFPDQNVLVGYNTAI